mmetsp:Transcript_57847/g.95956  ORF Transcript_57847/g.95956 Transcript_57847/m.95956 type:complete len:239 (-) Transcript_57847:60-776(-)
MGKCLSTPKETNGTQSEVTTTKKNVTVTLTADKCYDRFDGQNIRMVAKGLHDALSTIEREQLLSDDILDIIARYHQHPNLLHVPKGREMKLANNVEHQYHHILIEGKLTIDLHQFEHEAVMKLKAFDVMVTETGSIDVSEMGHKYDEIGRPRAGGIIFIEAAGQLTVAKGGQIRANGGHEVPDPRYAIAPSELTDSDKGSIEIRTYKMVKEGVIEATGYEGMTAKVMLKMMLFSPGPH